ncbi:hypothetical protein [Azospirillum thermophilum]|uniref:Sel1 repeat family protein n=1 Tax=Azospirillum thermophilum TaxID=2202148 RepID=A0A2S2CWZ4_9PROT|nr:hypothetical protein [Azospirillum thermophilum]AWK88797.1 hypothetical protein DEW08_22235 [Azospirillum thermophilum]
MAEERCGGRACGPGPGRLGCGLILLGVLALPPAAGAASLESWLGSHEAQPPGAGPAPTPAPTVVLPQSGAGGSGADASTDWRLMPFLAVLAPDAVAGQPTPLSIAVLSPYGQPNAGQEPQTYILIADIPDGAALSQGSETAEGTWRVPLEALPRLTMTLPPDATGSVTLHITAVTDHGGGVIARQSKDLTIPVLQTAAVQASAGAPPAQGGTSFGVEAVPLPGRSGGEPAPAASQAAAAEPAGETARDETAGNETAGDETAGTKATPAKGPAPEPPPPDGPPAAQPPPGQPPPGQPVAIAALAPPPPPKAETPPARPQEVVQRPAKLPAGIAEATLLKRGDALFAQGDLTGARLYYEMAAAGGNPKAALALGRTHDPLVHERLRVRGLAADPEQAASWYRKAAAAGDAEAERNLQKLTDWLAGKGR